MTNAPGPKQGSVARYLGNFAACEAWAAIGMQCDECNVSWIGCWDNFECPICRRGELPNADRNGDQM